MKWLRIFIVILYLLDFTFFIKSETKIIFWNVENLFDISDNPEKDDGEYTPGKGRYWSFSKYRKKCCDIAQTIICASASNPPAVIGLCEIENDSCVEMITKRSPVKSMHYKYYITDSPDNRGINIAMIWDPFLFSPFAIKEFCVPLEEGTTRNILYSGGIILSGDTLDLIFCHLPSRRGGVAVSDKNRASAYHVINNITDSLTRKRKIPNIVIMGDMNDSPLSATQKSGLKAGRIEKDILNTSLYNLSCEPEIRTLLSSMDKNKETADKIKYMGRKIKGTYRYQGKWEILDQIIVSGSLISTSSTLTIKNSYIFCAPFMLVKEEKYGGFRPLSTYYGYKYTGGISDHLPIIAEIGD